ncbi:MAG TPA: PEP-CTERM/exosortase system-associated acyltransferase [Fimbriimonadaceae bacterium]|nr:PEP-CTERM/exosortase system-associated acyltransferase [Fimbriimonadaceae bacterium]
MTKSKAATAVSDGADIGDEFIRHFDVVIARGGALLDAAFRLRYQVYCVENPFENAAEHPDGREIDCEDDRTVHSVIIHRRTGTVAGAVRLILPDADPSSRPLPMGRLLDAKRRSQLAELPSTATAEISRFAVSKSFRRRRGEERYPDVGSVEQPADVERERRLLPYLTYGLLRAILHMSAENDITHVCAVMEPALLRLVGHLGFEFELLGSPVAYHGTRQPCFGSIARIIEKVRWKNPGLWRYMTGFEVARRAPCEADRRVVAA